MNESPSTGLEARDTFGRPMRDLRISVLDYCNLRCLYCMPAEVFGEDHTFLRRDELLSFPEIARLARIFSRLGVRKIKITGGEPLLRPWLPDLIAMLKEIDGIDEVALITNGVRLSKMAGRLRDAGLDRVTISLDSLDEEVFARMSGRGHLLSKVLDSIDVAVECGFQALKFNTVVQRGVNDGEVLTLVEKFRGTPHIIRFIEYMDVGNMNGWDRTLVVPSAELVDRINRRYALEPVEPHYRGEVASRYRYRDGSGEIGFISSVTEPFCASCSRARITAEGHLYTCLFAHSGHDLKSLLRSGASEMAIEAHIASVWRSRADRYSELRTSAPATRHVEMFQIGG